MVVKKFEAKSIKEAIHLVKFHMGPEAIILSAKENVKRFGLMGETSVEVTAAVSENKLQSKKQAERKLGARDRERFNKASAHKQREFIKKSTEAMIDEVFSRNSESESEWVDENAVDDEIKAQSEPEPEVIRQPQIPRQNGITSVRYADIDTPAGAVLAPTISAAQPPVVAPSTVIAAPSTLPDAKALSLQQEVQYLRGLVSNFQKMPAGFVSLHPGADEGLPYELSFAFKRLADAGIAHDNIVKILKVANEKLPKEQKQKKAFVDGWVIRYLLDELQIADKPMRAKFHAFLGPTGQGKTSTVIKLACHLIMNEKKRVALVTGDVVKVGATDQFKIYAQILNAPYAVVTKTSDWNTLAPQLAAIDYVLFDTPGLNLKAGNDLEVLRQILPPGLTKNPEDFQTHFVQSIMARDTDAFEIAERFKFVGFQDVIFTRLDEAVQFGLIYNFQKKFGSPLHSFGIGNNVPEDFEFASKERVIDLLFKLSQFAERGQS